jgi:hypothetical protein
MTLCLSPEILAWDSHDVGNDCPGAQLGFALYISQFVSSMLYRLSYQVTWNKDARCIIIES